MARVLASLGFPTPDDNYPVIVLALLAVGWFCRDSSRQLSTTGRVLLVLLLIDWMLNDRIVWP
jgi:hypothetical protein